MKKHKNLSKQELMTGQDIPCVQLGGKFVSLDSKTEARQGGSRKKQAEQLLATVVMGMNLVNTVAPLAVLATAEQKLSVVPQPVRSEAEPLDYAVLPQLADVVDRAIFARAYATDYDGNASVADMVNGDKQTITAGQNGIVSTMSDGFQEIDSGGIGTVSTMSRGSQIISGGMGTVITMSSGVQTIYSGGTGAITMMSDGWQEISGGTGTVSTLNGGRQNAYSGGNATASTMMNGIQTVKEDAMGTVSTMSGGTQVMSGGTGTINTMNSGLQWLLSGGTCTIDVMHDGLQDIRSGGTGTIDTMNGGRQFIASGGTGTVDIMSGGSQTIVSGMQVANGVQSVASGGTAINTEISAGGSLQLSSGGIVSDLTLTSGTLELTKSDSGSLNINGTLTANNAVINMTDSSVTRGVYAPAYETLTIDKLSGSGTTFVMETNLADETNSDKITITDAATATHYVQIKDLSKLNGIEVTGAHQQLLITDNSGKLTFEGKEFNAGGLWDVDPTLAKGDSLGLSANDWYLTKLEKTVNNDTRVLLDAADNSYALWRNTNDSLRSRLGALASGSEQSDGIWARTQAGRFSGDNYEGRYNMYQLGFDQAADAKSVYGAAVDYGDGTGSYNNGSGKDKLKSFSLYGVWTGDNGAYTNVTARYGMVSTDLESYGDFPDKAEYKQHAYSVSVLNMASGLNWKKASL